VLFWPSLPSGRALVSGDFQRMVKRTALRLSLLIATVSLLAAAPVHAQYTPRTLADPAPGASYHIEAAIGFWNPSAVMTISSEALGIVGSDIDFKKDLGLTDQRFAEFHLVLRPGKRHKFRFELVPITFEQESVLTRDIIFQGQRYRVGIPVNSQLNWKAYRFGYEFDFISRNRGFLGFVLDAKYTDVYAALQSPINNESLHAKAPIPTIGGIGRVYVVPNISLTGEFTTFTIPDSVSEDYKGHFADFDLYGTVNFTNNVGASFGYRSFDVGYNVRRANVTTDAGAFRLKGIYLNGVVRF
jgi:hypothetical protein